MPGILTDAEFEQALKGIPPPTSAATPPARPAAAPAGILTDAEFEQALRGVPPPTEAAAPARTPAAQPFDIPLGPAAGGPSPVPGGQPGFAFRDASIEHPLPSRLGFGIAAGAAPADVFPPPPKPRAEVAGPNSFNPFTYEPSARPEGVIRALDAVAQLAPSLHEAHGAAREAFLQKQQSGEYPNLQLSPVPQQRQAQLAELRKLQPVLDRYYGEVSGRANVEKLAAVGVEGQAPPDAFEIIQRAQAGGLQALTLDAVKQRLAQQGVKLSPYQEKALPILAAAQRERFIGDQGIPQAALKDISLQVIASGVGGAAERAAAPLVAKAGGALLERLSPTVQQLLQGRLAQAAGRTLNPAAAAGRYAGGAAFQGVADAPENLTPQQRIERAHQSGLAMATLGTALHAGGEGLGALRQAGANVAEAAANRPRLGPTPRPPAADSSVVFASDLQRDLNNLGAAQRYPIPRREGAVEQQVAALAKRLGVDAAAVKRLALDVHDDVAGQMAGARGGETRHLRSNVTLPEGTPAASGFSTAPRPPAFSPEARYTPQVGDMVRLPARPEVPPLRVEGVQGGRLVLRRPDSPAKVTVPAAEVAPVEAPPAPVEASQPAAPVEAPQPSPAPAVPDIIAEQEAAARARIAAYRPGAADVTATTTGPSELPESRGVGAAGAVGGTEAGSAPAGGAGAGGVRGPVSVTGQGGVKLPGRRAFTYEQTADVVRLHDAAREGPAAVEAWAADVGLERTQQALANARSLKEAGVLREAVQAHREWIAEQERIVNEREMRAARRETAGTDLTGRDLVQEAASIARPVEWRHRETGRVHRYYELSPDLTDAQLEDIYQTVRSPARERRSYPTAGSKGHDLHGLITGERFLPWDAYSPETSAANKARAAAKAAEVKPETPPVARQWTAGNNRGTVVFEDELHRDLYDLGSKLRYRGQGGQNLTHQRPVGDIEGLRASVAERLGVDENTAAAMGVDAHNDVRAQMKGIREGETRRVANNVQAPEKAKVPEVAPPAEAPVAKGQQFGTQTERAWRAGKNVGKVRFEDEVHRDLYDLGAKQLQFSKAVGAAQESIRGQMRRLETALVHRVGADAAAVRQLAHRVFVDVRDQMQGMASGEVRAVQNSVPLPAARPSPPPPATAGPELTLEAPPIRPPAAKPEPPQRPAVGGLAEAMGTGEAPLAAAVRNHIREMGAQAQPAPLHRRLLDDGFKLQDAHAEIARQVRVGEIHRAPAGHYVNGPAPTAHPESLEMGAGVQQPTLSERPPTPRAAEARVPKAFLPPDLHRDYATVGAVKIAHGATKYSEWSQVMVGEFGEDLRPHLASLWKAAHAHAQEHFGVAPEPKPAAPPAPPKAPTPKAPPAAPEPEPRAQSTAKPAAAPKPEPPAPKPGPIEGATGLANQVQERELHLFAPPEKGVTVGAAEAHAEGKRLVREGTADPQALARDIARGERPFDWKEAGVLAEGKRQLINRVNDAKDALDAGIAAKAADVPRLQGEYDAAKETLQTFVDDVQKGKTEWGNTGRALQLGTTLDEGNFAEVLLEATRKRGKPLDPHQEQILKDLTGKVAEKDAAISDLETRLKEAQAQRVTAQESKPRGGTRVLSREKILQERASIRAEIDAILKETAGKVHDVASVTYDATRFSYAAGKLALNYMKGGAATLEEVVRQVIADLGEHGITATRAQVVDDIVELSKGKERTANEIRDRLAQLKREARAEQRTRQQVEGLETGRADRPLAPRGEPTGEAELTRLRGERARLQAEQRATENAAGAARRRAARLAEVGQQIEALQRGEKLPGVVRTARPPDVELDALLRERAELQKAQRAAEREAQRPERERKQAEQRTARRIADLTGRIADLEAGNLPPKTARAAVDPRVEALQGRERDLKQRLEAQAEIRDLEEQLRTGQYKIETPPERQASVELENLRARRTLLANEVRTRLEHLKPKGLGERLIGVAGAVRGVILGSDIGVLTRQGLFAWARPATALKATVRGVRSALSEVEMAKWENTTQDRVINGQSAAVARKRAGLQLTDTFTHPEEMVVARILKQVPGVGHLAGGLERFQTTFINSVRADLFDQGLAAGWTAKELKWRAEFINSATGRSNVRNVPRALQVLMTSPRYEASRWEMLARPIKDLGAAVGKPDVRRAALANAQDMGVTAAGIFGLMKAAEVLGGYQLNWNPDSSDFLKMRRGNDVWDVAAGLAPRLRDTLRLYVYFTHPTYKQNVGTLMLKGALRTISPAVRLPVEQGSMGIQRLQRVSPPVLPFEGFKAEDERQGFITLAPVIVQSMKQALDQEGPVAAGWAGAREFVGGNVNRYPPASTSTSTGKRASGGARLVTPR